VIRRALDPEDRAAAREAARRAAASEPGFFELALRELTGITRELRILSRVNADRARQRWRGMLHRAWTELWVAAATTTAIVAGVLLVALGLVRLLGTWLGRWPGAGEALVGLVLIGAVALVGWIRRRSRDQAEVRRLQEAYERLGVPPETVRGSERPAEGTRVDTDRRAARAD
jgi:hypothetical protein